LAPRTDSPSLHSCPTSGGASSFLLASALPWSPRGLATSRRTRRAMRPIDFCYPYRTSVYPPPRLLPAFTTAGFPAWAPHRVWARCGLTGGSCVFTTLEPLWWIDRTLFPSELFSEDPRRPGLCFAWVMARAWAFSSHGALVRPYLWHPCRLSLFHPPELGLRRLVGSRESFWEPRELCWCEEAAKTTVTAYSWKWTARDDPRCLPSVGTLRRIRWPLQPRSRDHRAAFAVAQWPLDDALTPPWVWARSVTVCPVPSDSRRPFDRNSRRRFTADNRSDLGHCSLAPSLFLEPCARAYSRPDVRLPTSANYNDVRALRPSTLVSSQGRWPQSPSFSTMHHALSLAEAVMHGELRSVRSAPPRCRFLLVAQVCPTAMRFRSAWPSSGCPADA